jgi:hypothetical protein
MLVNYIDENRPDLAVIYFKNLFLDHFFEKFHSVRSKLMEKIRTHNFY